jgi:citrate lyase beta subunit
VPGREPGAVVRHFEHLTDDDRGRLFHRAPRSFDPAGALDVLAVALGATLYLPATRPALAGDIVRRTASGLTSAVVCLEDAISAAAVSDAEAHAVAQLRELARTGPAPLVFLRVRCPEQVRGLTRLLGPASSVLSGFVFPKFTADSGADYLDALVRAEEHAGRRLLAMPVIESPEIIHRESRDAALADLRLLLDKYRSRVLAVRIGAADFSAAYGIRRPRGHTVYDVQPVANAIGDIVNVLGRADETGFVITGPVWEYFSPAGRKPDAEPAGELDGLIREITLDRANGLIGKTVIHPSHVAVVHALSVVSAEDYEDASDIVRLAAEGGGVMASSSHNKMNESGPHRAWAERVLRRAEVFGVARAGVSPAELLSVVSR